jgi:hypothetical protein
MNLILVVITLLSITVAATMSIVAWRTVRNEQRRSDARVRALAADIHGRDTTVAPDGDLPLRDGPAVSARPMFARAQPTPARPRLAVAAALGVLAVGAGAALVVVLGGAGRSTVVEPRSNAAQRAPAGGDKTAAPAPLELMGLGHERDGDSLTVRGVLRNPAGGREVSQLTAVVLLFDHDGGFVASGRAPVQAPTLEPGAETTFVITIPGVGDVGRYRVSFSTEAGVVPHVDRRG